MHYDTIMKQERRHKEIPLRPESPRTYPKTDKRHWYDEEYAGWQIVKRSQPPVPPGGPGGKRVEVFCSANHPYWAEYARGAAQEAEKYQMNLNFHFSQWDQEIQTKQFIKALAQKPDLIIFAPVEISGGSECIKLAYEAKIPIIGSNQVLDGDSYSRIIAWSGPDDWEQHRQLARYFASKVKRPGGYCLVTHCPGSSTYLARTWANITELAEIAPDLTLLDMKYTNFNREESKKVVLEWIDTYGSELVGIISADDSIAQEGINRAIEERSREDIVCVANGATRKGLGFIQKGSLSGVTFQPPERDGALAVKLAVDWFKGLRVPPITYLSISIITKENIDSFLLETLGLEDFQGEDLCRMILEGNIDEIEGFFDGLKERVINEKRLGEEYFGGFAIELVSNILTLADKKGVDIVRLVGGYEMLYKGLFQQHTITKSLDWLKEISMEIVEHLMKNQQLYGSLVDRLTAYISLQYDKPISLKTLSEYFGLSAAYLGKIFKEQTGDSFSHYLNTFRVEKAKVLLQTTEMKAKDVAEAVGYADGSYFYATFKKITGKSPSEYATEHT